MIPQAGERLGPYEIRGRLGHGGMGEVYRAWDGRLHREVAIKLLRVRGVRNLDHSGEVQERFLREARAASCLNHRNICTVFDIGEKSGAPYVVMELLEGETLRGRIRRGRLAVDDVVRCGCEVASALALAHARGIVHCDIKPANIFLARRDDGGWEAKVLDFGLAQAEQELTGAWRGLALAVGSDLGTPLGMRAYMAPEQARGERLDARADLFSLGVVLHEAATGRVAWRAGGIAGERPGTIPDALMRVIEGLLKTDREDRIQSAAELMGHLEELRLVESGRCPSAGLAPLSTARGSRPEEDERKPVQGVPGASPAVERANGTFVLRPLTLIDASRSGAVKGNC